MYTHLLYQFPVKALKGNLPRAWLLQEGTDGTLAVTYVSNKAEHPLFSSSLSFLLLDLKTKEVLKEGTSTYPHTDIESLELVYNPSTETWVISDLEYQESVFGYQVVIHTVHIDREGHLFITEPVWFDTANDMAAIGPFLDVRADMGICTVVYLKSAIDYMFLSKIHLTRIDITAGHARQLIQGEGECALLYRAGDTRLLLSCTPMVSKFPQKERDGIIKPSSEWRISAFGGKNDEETFDWRYVPDIAVPVNENFSRHRNLTIGPFVVSATVTSGPILPTNGLHTFVASMIMMNTLDNPEDKYSIKAKTKIIDKADILQCIDEKGNVVQTCADSVGLYANLCLSGKVIVGVDLLEGRWRLWNWFPLEEQRFSHIHWLDHQTQRALVVVEREQNERSVRHFWLVEESRNQVMISKRDAATLAELASAVRLEGTHLLLPQNGYGSLDWHISRDILFIKAHYCCYV